MNYQRVATAENVERLVLALDAAIKELEIYNPDPEALTKIKKLLE